jgi:hypothetical protein
LPQPDKTKGIRSKKPDLTRQNKGLKIILAAEMQQKATHLSIGNHLLANQPLTINDRKLTTDS